MKRTKERSSEKHFFFPFKTQILFGMQFYSLLGIEKSNEYIKGHKTLINASYWESIHEISKSLKEIEKKELFVTALSSKIYLFYDRMFNFSDDSSSDFSEYKELWKNHEKLF